MDRNRELQAKVLMAGNGKRNAMPAKPSFTKCMVFGDSLLRNTVAKYALMNVDCFPGIKTEQLHRVVENMNQVIQKRLLFT